MAPRSKRSNYKKEELMGEAVYSLKAQFRTKREAALTCRGLNKFLEENLKANMDSRTNLESYPLVKEYLQIIKGTWDDLQDYDLNGDTQAFCDGAVLIYSANVGHLGDWDNLQTYVQEKYKPIKIVWGSEEYGGSLDALQLYQWEGIVQAILKHKKTLPFLLGIHKDFDQLISMTLRKRRQ
jgi:hypothetical protein